MKNILGNIDWEEEMSPHQDDVDKLWEIFTAKYYEAELKCVPRKLVYVNGKKSKNLSTPLDKKTLRKIKKKNRLWSKKRQNIALEEEKLQYNKLRNQIRRLTRKAKKAMEKKIAKNSKKNPKSFWSYAKSKLKSKAGIPELEKVDVNGDITYAKENVEKAEVLLDYSGP